MSNHLDPRQGWNLRRCATAAAVPVSTPSVPMPSPAPEIPPLEPSPGTIDPPPDVINLPYTPSSPPDISEPPPDVIELPGEDGSEVVYPMEATTMYRTLRRDTVRWQTTFG